ncbi:hypothetical protein LMG28727_07683 [Paraburkholderia kirstenboschensis]|nr:hypothetical protein LMG28727_07683 [Paraburkholderia kirstenboschensis]
MFGQAKTSHRPLAFTLGLMAVFSAVVHSRAGLDENVLHIRQPKDLRYRGRVTAKLVGDDFLRYHGRASQYPFEEAFGSGLVAALLKQDVEFNAVLIDCTPQQPRLAAQRHLHFVEMPCAARLATGSPDLMRKTGGGQRQLSRRPCGLTLSVAPNLSDHRRIDSWLTTMPRSNSSSSTSRKLS